MMFIRPVEHKDLDGLMNLARSAGIGLTTLPVNEERLSRRIARSVLSFSGELDKADHCYVFVLEDSDTGAVAGICAIEAAVGLKEPWYNYRVGTIVHASEELGVYSRHETLFLSNDHTGYSELCTLFLHPDYRVKRNGGLLSKCRFLFLAQFPQLFGKMVVAEMRGVSDEAGNSPFWEALGRHFFSIDFRQGRLPDRRRPEGLRRRADAQAPGVCRLPAAGGAGGDRPDPRGHPPGGGAAGVGRLSAMKAMSTSSTPAPPSRPMSAISAR